MKDLLCCIAHHANPDRLQYLQRVLKAFADEYAISHDIIVDTNVAALLDVQGANVTICSHVSLEHPFHLCWQHRKHMRDRIEDYKYFYYTEDDIYLPFANFLHYQARFAVLWPNYVPGFIRVEKHDGEEWVVDVTERQPCVPVRTFHCALKQPYHGFWILPQEALKAGIWEHFVQLHHSREAAASFPMADLGKTALVKIEDGKVIPECWAYHISNSYAPCPTSPFGKLKVGEIFL